jgi:hypothetical protein
MNSERRPILKKFRLIPLAMWPEQLVKLAIWLLAFFLVVRLSILLKH